MRSHISNAFASVRLRREAIFDRCGGNVRGQLGAYTVPTRSLRTAEPDPRELGLGQIASDRKAGSSRTRVGADRFGPQSRILIL